MRSYEDLRAFVDTVSAAGCQTFIVHARKALLSGLSPKQNRMVPPLQHDFVYAIKRERPALHIVLNGGVKCVGEAAEHLQHVFALLDSDHDGFLSVAELMQVGRSVACRGGRDAQEVRALASD